MTTKMYNKYSEDTLVQTAKLKSLLSGKFAFETSLFGTKPYELNMNMPIFDTEEEAFGWIESTGKWSVA